MMRVQVYASDAAGRLTHAGTFDCRKLTAAAVWRAQRAWEKWRAEYLAANPGDYPLRHCDDTTSVQAFPVGQPEAAQVFTR